MFSASSFDFGDAPTGTAGFNYPTYLSDNGARHEYVGGGPRLGPSITAEADGSGSSMWADQDLDDGIRFLSSLVAVQGASTTASLNAIFAGSGGKLDAWIDFNKDSRWQASERIFNSRSLTSGDNFLNFSIPAGTLSGTTYARFRVSTVGGFAPEGAASDGEIEDYAVTFLNGNSLDGVHAWVQTLGSAAYLVDAESPTVSVYRGTQVAFSALRACCVG